MSEKILCGKEALLKGHRFSAHQFRILNLLIVMYDLKPQRTQKLRLTHIIFIQFTIHPILHNFPAINGKSLIFYSETGLLRNDWPLVSAFSAASIRPF